MQGKVAQARNIPVFQMIIFLTLAFCNRSRPIIITANNSTSWRVRGEYAHASARVSYPTLKPAAVVMARWKVSGCPAPATQWRHPWRWSLFTVGLSGSPPESGNKEKGLFALAMEEGSNQITATCENTGVRVSPCLRQFLLTFPPLWPLGHFYRPFLRLESMSYHPVLITVR